MSTSLHPGQAQPSSEPGSPRSEVRSQHSRPGSLHPCFIVPHLPPVFTNVHGPRATQKMLSGKTAAMMQWVLCWHLALIRQQSTGLKPRGGRLRDPPALSSSEVQNKGNLKKATLEHRTHSPHRSCCKLSIKNGSVIIMYSFWRWFWVQVFDLLCH